MIVITFVACLAFTVNAINLSAVDEASLPTEANSAKYHFYFDDEKYTNVYDSDTCIEAYLYM